jgi:hypothetical protein
MADASVGTSEVAAAHSDAMMRNRISHSALILWKRRLSGCHQPAFNLRLTAVYLSGYADGAWNLSVSGTNHDGGLGIGAASVSPDPKRIPLSEAVPHLQMRGRVSWRYQRIFHNAGGIPLVARRFTES